MKRCTKCGEDRASSAFHRDRTTPSGLQSRCKECRRAAKDPEKERAYHRAYREAHPERCRAHSLAWQRANRDKSRAASRAWKVAHPERARAHGSTRSELALPIERIMEMRKAACGICALPPKRGGRANHVDHDHNLTGPMSVRGTLCMGCNLSLGFFEKGVLRRGKLSDPAWRANAQAYLDRFAANMGTLALSPDRATTGQARHEE